jgi:glucose-1-phosphate adenylyltransferase
MAKIMGFCNLHGSKQLGPLTENRPLGSTSFLGRYALMDFTLSNFSNSGIDKIGILVETNPRSISKHLGTSNVFNNNTKLGFEMVLFNDKVSHNPLYNHDLHNLKANDWLILDHKPDVIVIAPADMLYTMDFRPVIQQHIENKEKLTLVYTRMKNCKTSALYADMVTIQEGRLTHMVQNQRNQHEGDVSLDTYIISRSFLEMMFEKGPQISATYGIKELLRYFLSQGEETFGTFAYKGYVRSFESLESYFQQSMEFLDYRFRSNVFDPDWPIYTISNNTPPARMGEKAVINNSMIANGAVIHGTVINSIISRNVVIEAGAHVENAILFTNSRVGKDVTIRHAILDKHVRVEKTKALIGKETPIYIKQGEKL